MTQKVLQIGTSAGLTISKDALAELGWKIGSLVTVEIDPKKKVMKIASTKHPSTTDERIAKLTMRFIDRYRTDLIALSKK